MATDEWNFEDSRSSDFSISEVISLIKPFHNAVSEDKLKFLHHGTYNVYEVDDYIFRIPDKTLYNENGLNLILKENNKLEFLRKKLAHTIPQPIFISDDSKKPLVGYKKIPGISIEKIWEKIPEDKILVVAKEIGNFLTEFHSHKMTNEYIEFFELETENQDIVKNNYKKIYHQTKAKIFPLIDDNLQHFIEKIFTDYFTEFDKGTFSPCLTHQDFDTSNILIDPQTYKITGIIDFEDMAIGDPAYDLIFINQGKGFFETILNNYTNEKDDFLVERIKFYYQRTGVPYLLYGIDHNLPDMIKYGKYLLEKRSKVLFKGKSKP